MRSKPVHTNSGISILVAGILALCLGGCAEDRLDSDGASGIGSPTSPSPATVTNLTQSYRWAESQVPLTLDVSTAFDGLVPCVEGAISKWNTGDNRTLITAVYGVSNLQATSSVYEDLYDHVSGLYAQYHFSNLPEVSSGVLAYTTTLTQNGKIIASDILFNFETYLFVDAVNNPPQNTYQYIDFQSVLTHELGHFLGFPHVSSSVDSTSIMNPSIGYNQVKRNLSTLDLSKLLQLYPN